MSVLLTYEVLVGSGEIPGAETIIQYRRIDDPRDSHRIDGSVSCRFHGYGNTMISEPTICDDDIEETSTEVAEVTWEDPSILFRSVTPVGRLTSVLHLTGWICQLSFNSCQWNVGSPEIARIPLDAR